VQQAPPVVQTCPVPQVWQLPPPVPPHALMFSLPSSTHVPDAPPLQHPPEHEVESHTHWPVVVLHSLFVAHPPQVAPPEPQVLLFSFASSTHADPLQHPAHDPPPQLHTPLAHDWPALHALHVAPAVPQEPGPSAA